MGLKGRAPITRMFKRLPSRWRQAKGSPVVLGGVAQAPAQANAMIQRGYRALVIGFDWSLLQRGISAATEGIAR
jgi:4-hydroxy-2-oxoheptanedioate aldolase